MNDNAKDFDYTCTEFCDVCGSDQEGIMRLCNDAMGMATPVLWTCNRCANPPFFVGVWRELKRRALRTKILFRFYVLTPPAVRKERQAKIAAARARMAARRATSC